MLAVRADLLTFMHDYCFKDDGRKLKTLAFPKIMFCIFWLNFKKLQMKSSLRTVFLTLVTGLFRIVPERKESPTAFIR